MAEEIIKYQPNGLIKKADNYLAHLNILIPKKYAPDLPELIPYRKGNKWGFCDRDKNIVIDCIWDDAKQFVSNFIIVEKNKFWFFLNKRGEIIPDLKIGYLPSGIFNDGLLLAMINSKYCFINGFGKIISISKYQHVKNFKKGFARVQLDEKWGFVDKTGNEIIKPKYDLVSDFTNGIALVGIDFKYGYINSLGKEITSLKYYHQDYQGGLPDPPEEFSEGRALVWHKYNCGFIDENGEEVIPLKYWDAGSFNNGLAWVKLDGKYGYINKDGNEVISLKYDYASNFSEGLAKIRINGQSAFIDTNGVVKIQLNLNTYAESFKDGLAFITLNQKSGFINSVGKVIIPLKYEVFWSFQREYCFNNGLARVIKHGKSGFINKIGNEVITLKYEIPETFTKNIVHRQFESFHTQLKKEVLDEINPSICDYISDFEYGLAKVETFKVFRNSAILIKSGFIDKLGNEYWED